MLLDALRKAKASSPLGRENSTFLLSPIKK